MFFQSTAHSYVCPMLATRRRLPLFNTEWIKSLLSEKLFLHMVAKATLVILFLVLVVQLWMGIIVKNIDESIVQQEQEYNVLVNENIGLLAEKAYLLSPQRIEKIAAEKLALFAAEDEQIKIIN